MNDNKLLIINYHNICSKDCILPGIDVDVLNKQFKFISKYMTVLPLKKAIQLAQQGQLPPKAVAITFDDGYKSHLTVAFPILKKYDLTATFFISSNHTSSKLMWNDQLYLAIMRSEVEEIYADEFELGRITIKTKADKISAFNKLVQLFKYQTLTQRHQLLDRLCNKLKSSDKTYTDDLMLDESEIKYLSDNGMTIGSHTLDHPILALEERNIALHQLSEDKARLEMITGKEIELFAFPNGKPGYDYNKETIDLIKQTGYKFSFTTQNTPFELKSNNIFEIPRMSAPSKSNFAFFKFLLSSHLYKNKQKNILFFENGKGFGGASLALAEILEHWPKDKGYSPFVCVNSHDEKYNIYNDIAFKFVFPSMKVPSHERKGKLATYVSFAWDSLKKVTLCINILRKVKPSLVHLNNDPHNCYHMAIAAKIMNIPYIMHVRGNMTPSKLPRWVCDNAALNVAISGWILDSIKQTLTKNKQNLQLISDGISLQPAPETLKLKPNQNIKMVMVGGFYGWKGQKTVAYAFSKIAPKYPNIYLDFVGSQPEGNDEQQQVESIIKQEGLESRVKLIPFSKDISSVYQQSHILIHASTDPEPFGRVIAEAMSAGLVVIASNKGGPLDIISDKEDGFLIPPNNPDLLSETLSYVIDNFESLERLRLSAISKAKTFSSEKNSHQVFQAILQNINSN